VAPAELEALLLTMPGVADAAVVGVKHQLHGEVPKAFVVRAAATTTAGEEVTEGAVAGFVAARAAAYKALLGGVEFVSSVPKSAAGKILRKDLRRMEEDRAKACRAEAESAPEGPGTVVHTSKHALTFTDLDSPLTDFVLRRAAASASSPGAPALVDGPSGRTITYGELGPLVRAAACGLAGAGLGKGQVLAILAPNLPEYAATPLAKHAHEHPLALIRLLFIVQGSRSLRD